MRTALCCWAFFLAAAGVCCAQDEFAQRILARYQALYPRTSELAMYRLDWADSLDEALRRGAREGRPILLVVIHAKYGDITSGHC